ncbi:MAG: histidine--tRNA ligase, partial [Thermoplasmata archaeon]|nr:histidine--tRNA ligase [Thermoplasmata archaeon]
MPEFGALRGFRDYPPPHAGARSELRRRMRAVARRCGYSELETPALEAVELFATKSGEEIRRQLWAFTDKGGREVTLVAETTPSLVRVFVERAKSEPLPVKWFTVSKLWRYEEPQAGRTREFGQFNLDVLGVPGIQAEVDLLATAALLMDECGAAGLYAFRYNDRELAEELGRALGATELPRYFRALDRSRKSEPDELRQELMGAGLTEASVGRLLEFIVHAHDPEHDATSALDEASALAPGERSATAIGRLRRLVELGARAGIADRLRFDPTVVRGLAYYTTTVFEAFDVRGDLRSLFGGGRYDHLVGLFGGPPTPACGLAVGDQTLELLLRQHDRWPEGEIALDTYVIAVTPAELPLAVEWVQRLRRAGLAADGDLMDRSISRQLREAARRKARRALILGPKELARGVIVERDLTTGVQRELAPDAVLPP